MQILGLRTSVYRVPDIDKAKEWYSAAFGTKPYFDEPFYVGYNIGGYELGLQPEEGSSEKAANVMVYWGVEDIHSEYQRFLDQGAVEFESPQNVGDNIIVAAVKDPWGNVIGLIYNPSFAPR